MPVRDNTVYNLPWFEGMIPAFTGGVTDPVYQIYADIAHQRVECWSARCGYYPAALAFQTAYYLSELGYPTQAAAPVVSTGTYDAVVKKDTVYDTTREYQIFDRAASAAKAQEQVNPYLKLLNEIKLQCVGTVTNTHLVGGLGPGNCAPPAVPNWWH